MLDGLPWLSRLPDARPRRPLRLHLRSWPVVLAAIAIGALGSGCSTTYQPRPSGRVGLVIQNGVAMYVKDGRQTPVGPLGGDLPQLVAETPAAVTSARRARRQLSAGVPSYAVGLGGVVVGLTLATPVGWVIVGVGAVLAGTGLTLLGAGVTNAVDAVNIHNDAASGQASPP